VVAQPEPEYMPKVGEECEIKHKDATEEWANPDFHYAKIKAFGDELFILESKNTCNGLKESAGSIGEYLFRPIKTRKQRVIEKAEKIAHQSGVYSDSVYLGRMRLIEELSNAGMLIEGGE
jgi:hypothetical protein